MKIGSISPSFPLEYFKECQEAIESNLLENIENDLKIDIYYSNIPRAFGQILIVDIDSIMKRKKEILEYMNEKYQEWCINIICLKDGKSYILTSSSKIAENMKKNKKQHHCCLKFINGRG